MAKVGEHKLFCVLQIYARQSFSYEENLLHTLGNHRFRNSDDVSACETGNW